MERLHFGVRQMFNVVIWGKVEDVILVKQWLDVNRDLCSEMGYVCVKGARSSGTGGLAPVSLLQKPPASLQP
jgi:hypothetical protein